MDLIDRYLAAIGFLLPGGQRADITAELRDVLMTRREERQAELGRPLTEDEEAALLRAFGHPAVVAARYAGPQYLVGPELYPHYVFWLKMILGIVAVVAVVSGVVSAATFPGRPDQAILKGIATLWSGTIETVGVLTLIAAVLQRWNLRPKALVDWNPRDLPTPPKIRRQTSFDHVATIVVQIIFILVWTHAFPQQIPYLSYIPLQDGHHLALALAPIWTTLYWPVLGLALGAIAVRVLRLTGDRHIRAAFGLDMVVQLGALIVVGIALRAGDWVAVSGLDVPAFALAKISHGVNIGVLVALNVAALAAAGVAVFDAWRLYRSWRGGEEPVFRTGSQGRSASK